MEQFAGDAFHTSRWDYGVDLKGKRVGIIGTGASAVQAVPLLAEAHSLLRDVGQHLCTDPRAADVRHHTTLAPLLVLHLRVKSS